MQNKNKTRVLVIAAHPDDEVLGVGGTIAWYSKIKKAEVYVLIITEGCSSQYKGKKSIISKKMQEAKKANNILGVKEVIFSNLPDMRLDSLLHIQLNDVIEKNIGTISPDIIYTHFPDINKDHVLIFESTMVAARPVPGSCVKNIFLYASCSSTEWSAPLSSNYFMPNVFVDISSTLNLKLQAFKCYKTEIREYPHPRSLESLEIYAKQTGITVGLNAAESFMLMRNVKG